MIKVNNISGINYTKNNRNVENKKTNIISERDIKQNSLDILKLQNIAHMNLAFKGINSSNRELTDSEFEILKKEFETKIKSIPVDIRIEAEKWEINKDNINIANKFISNGVFLHDEDFILEAAELIKNPYSIEISNKILFDDNLYNNKDFMQNAPEILMSVNNEKRAEFAKKILSNKTLCRNEMLTESAGFLIKLADFKNGEEIADIILTDNKLNQNENFMNNLTLFAAGAAITNNTDLAKKIMSEERLYGNKRLMEHIYVIFQKTERDKDSSIEAAAKRILFNEELMNNENVINSAAELILCSEEPEKAKLVNQILSDEKYYNNENLIRNAAGIINAIKSEQQEIMAKRILFDEKFAKNKVLMENAEEFVRLSYNETAAKLIENIITNEKYYKNEVFVSKFANILSVVSNYNMLDVIQIIMSNDRLLENEFFMKNADKVVKGGKTREQAEEISKILQDEEILPEQIIYITNKKLGIEYDKIKKLNKLIGTDKTSSLSAYGTKIAVQFLSLYGKENINEIPIKEKKELLKNLTASNDGLFIITDDMKKMFPLIPRSLEEYCSLLPAIVHSLGIETESLNNVQINDFNEKLKNLEKTVSKLTEEEFKNLEISQEYTKNQFISDVLNEVKDLSSQEKQKVYDYYGFELHRNKNASYKTSGGTGYSITGYPNNINNGEKLSQIKSEHTKEVIEKLRKKVIKFTENNGIVCNNKNLETDIYNIIKYLPELRPAIGNIQAGMNSTEGSHQYDIFKHSLKVLKGIVDNPEYKNLNDTDKRIMLLASLLHDITKTEGFTDRHHPDNSSFDVFFITKKFKLSKEEEIKLYNLIKHHEWLGYVNRSENRNELKKRQQSAAYDLRHDNMFKLSLIFTHADLKGVNDEFHDIKNEKREAKFDGIIRSYGEAAEFHAEQIKKYIEELKKSQPLLPVTELPKASDIEKAITEVKEDGATNIKGVYKDKDGLIILKYNELENEDLIKIGFPKGSTVKGISSKTSLGEDVNTGNVKFFAHGLDFPNQLVKFDAFSLMDSEVLLSASYAERPESKSRFFRPQGILLDCDTKYVHGGGNTDMGSGCGKFIDEFKQRYIFGGDREEDRKFISDLIKETLKISDEEYIEFVKDNENKSFQEIEPEDIRNKIIRALSGTKSNIREGKREYNEMYISNPKPPMAVFAYAEDWEEKIKNPVEFLQRKEVRNREHSSVYERTEFLRQYALNNNLPFVVFGE